MAESEAGVGGGVNWSAAGTVELFDEMQRRRARWRLLLVSVCLVLVLGIPLWVLRGQLQDAARQTLQGEYDREQVRLQGLASSNPAVRKLAERAESLRAGAGLKSADLAIPDLREALGLIDQAEQLDKAERGLRELLNPLGETVSDKAWYDSSDWIKSEKDSVIKEYKEILAVLDGGEIAAAESRTATLLRSLGQLQVANVQAMQADVIRRDWQRMLSGVPERLRGEAEYQSVRIRGEQGDGAWREGKWQDAGLSYGGAIGQLQQWLDGVLTVEEKATAAALSEGEIARLESEKQVLKAEKAELAVQLKALTAQVSAVGGERDRVRAEADQAQAELQRVQGSLQETEKKLAAETGLRTVREQELKQVQGQADSLKGQLAAALAQIAAEESPLQQQNELNSKLIAEGKRSLLPASMIQIKGGTFQMGSNIGESDEKPVHTAKVSGFWIGAYEVTIAEVLEWVNAPGVVLQAGWIDLGDSDCPIRRNGTKYELNTATTFGKSARQPMGCISQRGATAYCQWLQTQHPGWVIRLPYEAEWEYAARAGSTTKYPWGDSITTADANIDGGPGVTTEVGKYRPNAWGLYDTVGNVWEWCADNYDSDYYSSSPTDNPRGPEAAGVSVVCRSGSWFLYASDARSAHRSDYYPDYPTNSIGFRIVAE